MMDMYLKNTIVIFIHVLLMQLATSCKLGPDGEHSEPASSVKKEHSESASSFNLAVSGPDRDDLPTNQNAFDIQTQSTAPLKSYEDFIPAGTWPSSLWGVYKQREISDPDIKPQVWRNENHTITGWDWSLPAETTLSPRSLLSAKRYMNFGQVINLPASTHFKGNLVVEHWVRWTDIEPEEGNFKWDILKERLDTIKASGYNTLIRLILFDPNRAPDWVVNHKDITTIHGGENFDPNNGTFNGLMLNVVEKFGESNIPARADVLGVYVGYASESPGDEGIGDDNDQFTKPKLDKWAEIMKGMEHKVYMGGPSQHGFGKGFGVRRGFVENYLYHIPDEPTGAEIDSNGYLWLNEDAWVIKNKDIFNGEINEEYSPDWATSLRKFRFGDTTASFPYRYFASNLRILQMRVNFANIDKFLVPQMVPWFTQQLGRTVEDTPDAWTHLRQNWIKLDRYKNYDTANRPISDQENDEKKIPIKNFERWVYQRDSAGFETIPAVKISHPHANIWITPPNNDKDDYIARAGRKIGFAIDDRFLYGGPHSVVIKVTYFDMEPGTLSLNLLREDGTTLVMNKELYGDKKLKTRTFRVNRAYFNGEKMDYDFVISGDPQAVVSFVRVIPTLNDNLLVNRSNKQCSELPDWNITDNVCGASNKGFACTEGVSIQEANNTCAAAGGRLCQDFEIIAAKATGCGFDNTYNWTRTPCNVDGISGYYVVKGNQVSQKLCQPWDKAAPVRCCADIN